MDNDYFESLMNTVQNSEGHESKLANNLPNAFLTVKVDIDCKLYCDGDFLDLFEANKVKKISIQTGQHLMSIVSEHFEEVTEDRVIDAPEPCKNYLLLVNGLKQREETIIHKIEKDKRQEEVLRQEGQESSYSFPSR